MPNDLNPTTIGSVSKYLFVAHTTRGLVELDKNGVISDDLASSWTISPDQRVFKFKLKKIKFSNGEDITAKSIVDSIEFRRMNGPQIHFDFNNIASVSGSLDEVTFVLKKSSPLFLYQLTHPEFGILHKSTIQNPEIGPRICSGHYCLKRQVE